MSKQVVHLPPVRETHDSRFGYAVIRGRDVENHETQLAQIRTSGYVVTEVPDNGRNHMYWTIGAGAMPCDSPRGENSRTQISMPCHSSYS